MARIGRYYPKSGKEPKLTTENMLITNVFWDHGSRELKLTIRIGETIIHFDPHEVAKIREAIQ